MNVPPVWAKATGECESTDHRKLSLVVWGWGNEEDSARREASSRLARLIERIRRGESPPHHYLYGSRPLREEILRSFVFDGNPEPRAILTRNRYGALVLNTAGLLFLDVDVAPSGPALGDRIRKLFWSKPSVEEDSGLAKLRDALRRYGRATFRLYRTAAGLRAIAVDREFDPAGREAQDLMKATGTDPAFVQLCLAQKSFRARLTPKPWRCHCPSPPSEHPRTEDDVQQRFAEWVRDYEAASSKYATCRFVETVGAGSAPPSAQELIAFHDRSTRADAALPLA
jgi:hypothetical protein